MLNQPTHSHFFFALDLPSDIKQQLSTYLASELNNEYTLHDMRWVKKDNFHITLQFLNHVKDYDIPKLIENTSKALATFRSFNLAFGATEWFPSPSRPKVLSLQVGPKEILTRLAQTIGQAIIFTDYPIEQRVYRPHLTLGCLHRPENKPLIPENIASPSLNEININDIVLFKSEPGHNGSKYTPLARISLLPTM